MCYQGAVLEMATTLLNEKMCWIREGLDQGAEMAWRDGLSGGCWEWQQHCGMRRCVELETDWIRGL